MVSLDDNLIKKVSRSLTTQNQSPEILKNSIFTLSNLMADKSIYLQQILNLGIMDLLVKIWGQLRAAPDNIKIVDIKNEILYCVGNCTLGIRDSLCDSAYGMLKQAIDQGALIILAEALSFKTHKMNTSGLHITLDSLKRYFKFFKQA